MRSKGICILAGAGPGDIGLVTLRTKEAVEQAEVIVYDYLCNSDFLKSAPPEAGDFAYAYRTGRPARRGRFWCAHDN